MILKVCSNLDDSVIYTFNYRDDCSVLRIVKFLMECVDWKVEYV